MLRRPIVVRGRPGLLGTMARTAVVAGTATATAGAIRGRQERKAQAAADQQAAQQAAYDQQAQLAALQQQVATQPAPSGDDLTSKLAKLAELHSSGALTDAEYTAAKAKLIS